MYLNAKRAKRLRKQLRESGLDVREAAYDYDTASVRRADPYSLTVILQPQTGRKIYRGLKNGKNI